MRIDLPTCGFKPCRYCFDGNCTNTVCHMCVDDAKANDKAINLVQDQFAHIVQIIWTWFLCL